MSTSDAIQIVGIICTSVLSIVSVAIAILTLRQNSRMIEESLRPYVVISYEVINTGSPNTFFLLKNYGQSGAKIIDFKCDTELTDEDVNYQFSKIPGTYLAPQQKKLYWFDCNAFKNPEIEFEISYQSQNKIYREIIPLKVKLGAISLRSESRYEKVMSNSIQEIVERLI